MLLLSDPVLSYSEMCVLIRLASKSWLLSSLGSFSAVQGKALQMLGNSDQTIVALSKE